MRVFRFWLGALVVLAVAALGLRAEPVVNVPTTEPVAVTNVPAAVAAPVAAVAAEVLPSQASGPVRVKVIPVRGPIAKPILYVLRRGLKEAQAEGMQAVVIDMETPGGELGVTLEIMEALDKFNGETVVYVNKEAVSAGAIISAVADKVYFAPGGVIGAAEVVQGGGADVPEAMKRKVNSFMNAKIRAYNETNPLRGEVIKAMMDAEFEFKVDDKIIKPKGELLSLTASEAEKMHGAPPRALFSSGTYATMEELLAAKYGKGGYTESKLEVSWSEELASSLSKIAPVLMGLGLLCVFIEFKTPGFGVFGITGGLLLALVFFGHYAAGLSGHEPALIFVLGVVLVAVELFLFPGTLVAGVSGLALMFGALVWSMVDVWPGEMPSFDGETFMRPFVNLAVAILVAVGGALALAKFLPRGWFWDKMILQTASPGDAGAPVGGMGAASGAGVASGDALIGARGRTVSALRPMGEVEIAGQRHEAKAALGTLERGVAVRVTARSGRVLLVEEDAT
jgi:membrane-bound serine protease (ClpP class)